MSTAGFVTLDFETIRFVNWNWRPPLLDRPWVHEALSVLPRLPLRVVWEVLDILDSRAFEQGVEERRRSFDWDEPYRLMYERLVRWHLTLFVITVPRRLPPRGVLHGSYGIPTRPPARRLPGRDTS